MFLPAISRVVRLLCVSTRISPRPGRMNALRLSVAAALAALLAGMPLAAQQFEPHDFGDVELGNTTAPYAFTFTFSINHSLVSAIQVQTQGKDQLDFNDAGGGTCHANMTYNKGDSCTVDVSFTPTRPGTHGGLVSLLAGDGTTLKLSHVRGTGVGPQPSFFITYGPPSPPDNQSTLDGGLSFPAGVTVDENRQVSADHSNNSGVNEISPDGIATTLGGGFSGPWGVALDGAGNVFVADQGNNAVKEILAVNGSIPASPTIITLGSGFNRPTGVAVDGGGNIIVADQGNNAVKEIVALGGYTTILTLGSGFNQPQGVAVDWLGNVFVADTNNHAVKEIPASCIAGANDSSCVLSLGSGFSYTYGVAVDGSGNVFVTDSAALYSGGAVKEILAAGGYTTINTLEGYGFFGDVTGVALDGIGNVYFTDSRQNVVDYRLAVYDYGGNQYLQNTSFSGPEGVAVDGRGNVFVADTGHNAVVKLDYADPPSLSFAMTHVGSTSSDSPQYVSVQNFGNAPLVFTKLSYPADFPEAIGDSNACTSSTSLPAGSAGEACDLPINFSPKTGGSLSEALVLTDNALNVNGATQSIPLSGSAPSEASLTSPTPGSTLTGTSATFTWSAGEGVSHYEFRLGTTGPGSKNVYNAADVTTTALTTGVVSNIPAGGGTLFARLYSMIDGAWQYKDYTYKESGTPVVAALTSPTPGSKLTGTSATFTWSAGKGVSYYMFRLGTTGPGSKNVYNAADVTTTALTSGVINNIPAGSKTLYARIYSMIDGAWQYKDYTYTEAP